MNASTKTTLMLAALAALAGLPRATTAQYTNVPDPSAGQVISASDGQSGEPAASDAPSQPALSKEQLAQLVAPVALYPDSLLSQVLMASTYPLEVVQADRWVKANPSLKGDDLAKALDQQTWDASVKSLANFPQILQMMSDQLDTTVKLGNAFIAQQSDMMAAVQDLRGRAQQAGTLKTDDKFKVTTQAAEQPADQAVDDDGQPQPYVSQPQIAIEQAQPDVVYVPSYDASVYGSWPYADYAPYDYHPYGWVAGNSIWYSPAYACGPAWGWAWGGCDWHRRCIDVDWHRHERFNHFIDRDHFGPPVRPGGERSIDFHDNHYEWFHDPHHRDGVPYANDRIATKFGETRNLQAEHAREAYRGRITPDQRDIHIDDARAKDAANRARNAEHSGQSADRAAHVDEHAAHIDEHAAHVDDHPAARVEQRQDDHAHQKGDPQPDHSFYGGDRSAREEHDAAQRGEASRRAAAPAAPAHIDAPRAEPHGEAPRAEPSPAPARVEVPRAAPSPVPAHVEAPRSAPPGGGGGGGSNGGGGGGHSGDGGGSRR